jgi:glycosyltransferase involved in cell wall biosynthesis
MADIGLILEGTYPYVAGGVSSWVHQIIRGFPEYRFALAFIGSSRSDYAGMKYQLPQNVVHLQEHYIHGGGELPAVRPLAGDAATYDMVEKLHEHFRAPHKDSDALIGESLQALSSGGQLTLQSFLHSRASWDYTTEQYRRFSRDPSFIDYFWTVRTMHRPLWMLAQAAASFPPVRILHVVSTGYAGFLAAMLRWKSGRPLILSEHGIYTKERKIDLFHSEWIRDQRDPFTRDPAEIGYLRQLWIRFFESLGRMCYRACDEIVSLYEANRQRQIADGAPPERTRIVPNGVDLARLSALRAKRAPNDPPPVLCLLGRVVPIKDVKTFIRAVHIAAKRMPQVEGWIAGPEDEDPGYAEECRVLARSIGVGERIRFLGFQKIEEVMPKVGVLALSSISEGLPLVLLEGFAAGVPAVVTDVGSCRQLIHGLDGEDAALGAAGRVVGIADPQALAGAALELLGSAEAWRAAQAAGIARVERYYSQERLFAEYREIYRRALVRSAGSSRGPARPAGSRCPHAASSWPA